MSFVIPKFLSLSLLLATSMALVSPSFASDRAAAPAAASQDLLEDVSSPQSAQQLVANPAAASSAGSAVMPSMPVVPEEGDADGEGAGSAMEMAPPSALEELTQRLTAGAEAYSGERLKTAEEFKLPYGFTVQPHSAWPNTEFNTLNTMMADGFYVCYAGEEEAFGKRRQQVSDWLRDSIERVTADKKSLDERVAARVDGVLGDLSQSSKTLETKLTCYRLIVNETFFHFDQTQQFVRYTLGAIATLQESITALETLIKVERNAATRAQHESIIETQRNNIEKFKFQILSAEALMHALYPYFRDWKPMSLSLPGFGEVHLPWVSVPSASPNSADRERITGQKSLPQDFAITSEMLGDNAGDKEGHYEAYVQAMLADEAFMLKAAKAEGRIVFGEAAGEEKADA